jgi:hypothetical protein
MENPAWYMIGCLVAHRNPQAMGDLSVISVDLAEEAHNDCKLTSFVILRSIEHFADLDSRTHTFQASVIQDMLR